jgi:hypothetical protein
MKTHRNNHFAQAAKLGRWLSFPAFVLVWALATSARANDNYEYSDPLASPADTNGWSQFADYGVPATFTITNGGYRLQAGAGGVFGAYPGPYGVGLVYTNFQVSIDAIDWDRRLYPTNLGNICIFARGSGLTAASQPSGQQNGYLFSLQPNSTNNDGTGVLRITRIDLGITASNEACLTLPINNTNGQYRLVFNGSGPLLTGTLFNLTNLDQPIATIQLTDSIYPSGAVGIAGFDGAAALELKPPVYLPVDFTVNNFQAGPPTPSLNIRSAVILSWPDSYADYSLESSTSVNGPWQPLNAALQDNGGVYSTAIATTNAAQFFQLYQTGP